MKPSENHCPNCDTALAPEARFCSHCGQDTHLNKQIPFTALLLDFLEGLIDFDTKIWRTLIQLLKNPGRLVKDFNQHKRARYVPPVRLYLTISVLFFLLADGGVKKQAHEIEAVMKPRLFQKGFRVALLIETVQVDSVATRKLLAIPAISVRQVDSVLQTRHIQATLLSQKVIQQLVHLQRKESSFEEIGDRFLDAFSKLLFALMPLFALLLWLLLNPKKYFFTEVFIYSVYFHSLYFILLILAWVGNQLAGLNGLNYLVYLVACVYTVPGIRVAFNLSLPRALGTSFGLILVYTILFFLVMTFALIGSMIV